MYKDNFTELLATAHDLGWADREAGVDSDAEYAWDSNEEWARDVTEQHIEDTLARGGKPFAFFDELALTREAFVDSYEEAYYQAGESGLYA